MLVNLDVKATPVAEGNAASDPTKNNQTTLAPETPAQGKSPAEPTPKPGEADEAEEADILIGDQGEGDEEQGDEPETANEEEAGEGEENDQGEGERQRLTRNQRKNLKIRALTEETSAKDARIKELEGELARRTAPKSGNDDLVEPKEEDFPNNYLAFEDAKRAYQIQKAIRDENSRSAKERTDEVAQELQRVRISAYNERLEAVKDRIPDFDETLSKMKGVEIRNDVRDLVLESAKGPLLAYHLAKNPETLADLNRMTPIAAAREIGRLESRLRGPQPKKKTEAPAPLSRPRGSGTTGTRKSPEDMSMEEYYAARDSGRL